MTSRQEGSGFGHSTAAGVEELFAARLTSDRVRARGALATLQIEFANGWCGIDPITIDSWLKSLAKGCGLTPTRVVSQPGSGLGDLEITLRRGMAWIEVKAQTKKALFGELVQVDWVRDSTDALTWLFHNDQTFAKKIPGWAQQPLHARRAYQQLTGWSFGDLFVADLALVYSGQLRNAAGIRHPKDLRAFLAEKYLLHVTQEGARFVRLDDLLPASRWVGGSQVIYALKQNVQTAVAVQVAVGVAAGHGTTHFTYHVAYQSQVLGRHKLHEASLTGVPQLVVS